MLLIIKGVVNFTLEQAMKTQKREYKYDSTLSLTSALDGLGGQRHSTLRRLHSRERNQEPIVQEAGWAPVQNWAGAENLTIPGIRFPDCSARSESLRCSGPTC
jgi:hypothetical protein